MSSPDYETKSPSDSDSGSDGLQDASASSTRASRALCTPLHDLHIEHQTGSASSQRNGAVEQRPDTWRMLAAIEQEFPINHQTHGPSSIVGTSRSSTSSMRMSVATRSTIVSVGPSSRSSAYTAPSLSLSASTARSGISASTGSSAPVPRQYYKVDESGGESSEAEDDVRLECCFGFLQCPGVFEDLETWDRHSRSHYRRNPPAVANCVFPRCSWVQQAQSVSDIWEDRLRHMQQQHTGQSYTYPRGRLGTAFAEDLLRSGMIDLIQYQELRVHGRLSDAPVRHTASRREDRRQRRQY